MSFPGVYFDGASAERRPVVVSLGGGGLAISRPDGGALAVWPLAAVERSDDEGRDGATRLACGAARLRVEGAPFAAALRAVAPALAPRSRGRRALRSLPAGGWSPVSTSRSPSSCQKNGKPGSARKAWR